MADFEWPDAVVPYSVEFWLQPHTGGAESPFSRKGKYYGLSAPRWVCRLGLRGGDSARVWGTGRHVTGPAIDALLAKLEGRLKTITIHDFRRPRPTSPVWPTGASNLAAAVGDTSITITGLQPGTRVHAGDYVGGDGRPHIILDDVYADTGGQAVVSFKPPLAAAVGAGAAIFSEVTGTFRQADDDAGTNPSEVGQLTHYSLTFVEDL